MDTMKITIVLTLVFFCSAVSFNEEDYLQQTLSFQPQKITQKDVTKRESHIQIAKSKNEIKLKRFSDQKSTPVSKSSQPKETINKNIYRRRRRKRPITINLYSLNNGGTSTSSTIFIKQSTDSSGSSTPHLFKATASVYKTTPRIFRPRTHVFTPNTRVFKQNTHGFTPVTNVFKPTTQVFESAQNGFETSSNVFKPTTNVFERTANRFETSSNVFKPTTNVFEQTANGFETSSNVFKPTTNVFEQTANGFETSSNVFKPTTNVFERTANRFETSSNVFKPTTNVFEQTANGFETSSNVFKPTTNVFEQTANGFETSSKVFKPNNVFEQTANEFGPAQTTIESELNRFKTAPNSFESKQNTFDPASTAYDPASTIFDPSPTVFDPAPTIFDPAPTVFDPAPNTFDPAPVVFDQAPDTFEPAPKVFKETTTIKDESSLSDRNNRTLTAAEMKRQYYKYRSSLPGASGESNWDEIHGGGGTSSSWEVISSRTKNFGRESSSSRFKTFSRGSFISKQQRSADESNGDLQSGRLKENLHKFIPSDLVLPFGTQSSQTGTSQRDNNSNSVGSIAQIVKERLGDGPRSNYDSSILVDVLSLIALQGSDRNTRSKSQAVHGQNSRRRGSLSAMSALERFGLMDAGSATLPGPVHLAPTGSQLRGGRIVQRKLNLTPTLATSRATSKLEAPLLFSDVPNNLNASDNGTTTTTTTTTTEQETTSVVTPSANETSEFGPFSDGNDPDAGVSPPPLPPVLRASLYSYLLPRLMSLAPLTETIPGVPGLDYPIMNILPYTNFYCNNMPWPGFYADTEARCQAWHLCDLDGRQASFLCPNGTIFNQAFMVCDWWYNSDCQAAPYLYPLNERLFQGPELPPPTQQHRTLTAQVLDTLFI